MERKCPPPPSARRFYPGFLQFLRIKIFLNITYLKFNA